MSVTPEAAEADAQTETETEAAEEAETGAAAHVADGRQPAAFAFPSTIRGVNHTYKPDHLQEDDDVNAPKMAILPDGRHVGRVVVQGVLRSVEDVSSEGNEPYLKAEVYAGGESVSVMAGQYQPDVKAELMALDEDRNLSINPVMVSVTGKINTYTYDDTDDTYANIRPESISTISPDTYDEWEERALRATVESTAETVADSKSDSPKPSTMAWTVHNGSDQATDIATELSENILPW